MGEQVEYYFSDRNLSKDEYFRDSISQGEAGWVDADCILKCPRILQIGANIDDLAKALQNSSLLERDVDFGEDGVCIRCLVRRVLPFQQCTGEAKGKTKGKVAVKGKSSDSIRNGPSMERVTPCGYHLA